MHYRQYGPLRLGLRGREFIESMQDHHKDTSTMMHTCMHMCVCMCVSSHMPASQLTNAENNYILKLPLIQIILPSFFLKTKT